MTAVVIAHPGDQLHVVDLPYRLCSWAFDAPDNCAIWEDVDGQVRAWAVLQSPFWSVDYAIHPAAPPDTIHAILAWADQRAQAIQHTPFARPAWYINGFTGHHHRQILEDAGFHSQADVGEHSWTKVLFQRGAMPLPADQSLPAGFRIRPLNGHAEVDAYVALHRAVFQSESMTNAWRHRTLGHPAYLPQLDLVLTDADGLLAGFCIGWFTPQGPQHQPAGQVEPIGIRADVRNRGLGRALLGDCLARLAAAGASSVFVETDNYRDAAFNFYTAMDFRVVQDVTVYRKDYVSDKAQPCPPPCYNTKVSIDQATSNARRENRMDHPQFKESLAAATPPPELSHALQALWYDAKGDWAAAHEHAQAQEDAAGAWVHAYLHRKEGDPANAAYWYRRAGQPVATLALEAEWDALAAALLAARP